MGHSQTTNFLELPSLSGGLLSTVKPKQSPVHKLENKENGQVLSSLHEFLFKDLEVTDPTSSQTHLLMTDCTSKLIENNPKIPPGCLVAVEPALPLVRRSFIISPLAMKKLSGNTEKPQAKETGIAAWCNVFPEMYGWP